VNRVKPAAYVSLVTFTVEPDTAFSAKERTSVEKVEACFPFSRKDQGVSQSAIRCLASTGGRKSDGLISFSFRGRREERWDGSTMGQSGIVESLEVGSCCIFDEVAFCCMENEGGCDFRKLEEKGLLLKDEEPVGISLLRRVILKGFLEQKSEN
jgi:hypothetical protein